MVHEITLTEQEAKDAVVLVQIKRDGRDNPDTIFTVVFKEDDDNGSLYLEVSEDSNPTESIANTYPEFFSEVL